MNKFTISVIASNNARQTNDGSIRLKDIYLQLGGRIDGQNKHAIYFPNVEIPNDAEIVNAKIEFYSYSKSPMGIMNIYSELGDAVEYLNKLNELTFRNYSSHKVKWVLDNLMTDFGQCATPNLKNIIDENRLAGWKSGENISFYFVGASLNGGSMIRGLEGNSRYHPKLFIEYINNGNGPHINEEVYGKTVATIISNTDDVSESITGVITTGEVSLSLGGKSDKHNINAFRFQNVELPDRAEVINAYIEFYAYGISPAAGMQIYSELNNASGYMTTSANVTLRDYSTYTVNWFTHSWLKNLAKNMTPNLKNIIDEARINYWHSGDNLAFLFKGITSNSGARAYVYEGGVWYRPRLVIEYINNGKGPHTKDEFEGSTASIVMAATDDARENHNGVIALSSTHLPLGGRSDVKKQAVRFQAADIPADAEISDAYIEFYSYASSPASKVNIYTEIGQSVTYATTKNNISSRRYSGNKIEWETTAITKDFTQLRTPNLKNIIDENRLRSWRSGESLSFMFEGLSANNGANVRSYEGGELYRPRLVVEYLNNGMGASVEGALIDPILMTQLYINEISPQGTLTQKKGWIELFNHHDNDLVIYDGVYISNKEKDRKLHELKELFIPAKGYVVLIADKKTHQGNNHLNFDLKGKGGTLYLSRGQHGNLISQDNVTYPEIPYQHSYGRLPDGTGEFRVFISSTFDAANDSGQEKIEVLFSHQRGIYPDSFELIIAASDDVIVHYTLDAKTPSEMVGQVYSSPLVITQTCVVRIYAYNDIGHSGVISQTYVLLNNYKNEVAKNGFWICKATISPEEYARALSDIPILSISSDVEPTSIWRLGDFEYIDSHVYQGRKNFYSSASVRKFGQESVSQLNSGIKFKFNKDAFVKKAKYDFFDIYPHDSYPTLNKIQTIELKEGQDGPSRNVFGLGFMRYSEKIVMNLQKEMGKYALDTRYVNLFVNGKYRGVKTMRNDFKPNNLEDIFGDDADNYTKINLQDGHFAHGVVKDGDGDPAIWVKVRSLTAAKNFQALKDLVDFEDLIKFQILFMFIDTENETTAIMHNNAPEYMKAKFMINDTDGSFFGGVVLSNGNANMVPLALPGGGGNYKYKWLLRLSLNGPAGIFGAFMGVSGNTKSGNLEFKTRVKDSVLALIGPASGDFHGAEGAPLSVRSVQKKIVNTVAELNDVYKLDAAFQSFENRHNVYEIWSKTEHPRILAQVPERVSFSLKKWLEYNMAHTLEHVTIEQENGTLTLNNPNVNTQSYYTLDGCDPMGNDGTIAGTRYTGPVSTDFSKEGLRVTVRAYTENNWGPVTKKVLSD